MKGLYLVVFIGGALGAMVREFIMILVPKMSNGFPLDIFVANVAASFLLGLATYHHRHKNITDEMILLFGVGALGGMSTFSSFAYGAFTEIQKVNGVAISMLYILSSVIIGFIACGLGLYMSKLNEEK
ncbi:CrcB family protein [Photobacterium phosphoreum]|uniref:CrcB family protein n=1 Tax=Photobacterium phosphoreum TaxID=659 RepID=UPI0024BA2910|nr:CrcB family protein [Photobacterium phosphoreum]